LSSRYGEGEGFQNDRWFNNYTEESFTDLIERISDLTVEKIWITPDARADRNDLNWLNVILKKIGD